MKRQLLLAIVSLVLLVIAMVLAASIEVLHPSPLLTLTMCLYPVVLVLHVARFRRIRRG